MIDLFLVSGEVSGDLQGAHLVEALLKRAPHLKLSGVAGPRLRALGVEGETRMEELQVMGFVDVLFTLPRLIRLFYRIRNEILELNPKGVVLIDYPGLNLRLAKSLRKAGYRGKLIQYICPTVWAWGKGRIPLMEKYLDLLLTLFPFEPACFAKTKLPAFYVGHPLSEKTAHHRPFDAFYSRYSLDPKKKILAIFPGSREKEILRNLPLQLQAARMLQKSEESQIVLSLAQERHRSLLQGFPVIEPEHRYDLMQKTHLALATSGTVNLELALFQTPCVVSYFIRPLDVFLAQKIFRIRLPHYCIVNILARQRVYPELFGPHLTQEALERESLSLWRNPSSCRAHCASLRTLLEGVERDAANHIAKSLDFKKDLP